MTVQINDLIGCPFEYGARGPHKFDCWGLCLYIMRAEGKQIPDYTSPTEGSRIDALIAAQMQTWKPCEIKPGAVLVFKTYFSLHCGYALGGDYFLHAFEQSNGVARARISDWKRRFVGAYEYRTAHA